MARTLLEAIHAPSLKVFTFQGTDYRYKRLWGYNWWDKTGHMTTATATMTTTTRGTIHNRDRVRLLRDAGSGEENQEKSKRHKFPEGELCWLTSQVLVFAMCNVGIDCVYVLRPEVIESRV